MKKITNLLMVLMFLTSATIFAQTITGTVNAEDGPLPGANVIVKGTTTGTQTDFDGKFTLSVPEGAGTIVVSFVGYGNKEVAYTVAAGETKDLGTITLASDNTLEEVVIVGTGVVDVVQDRQTPIAVSTIKAAEIQAKAGNQEFPEIMRSTPSVYVTKQGGGFGDSRINLRGFDQSNTAFLLNGQPINGMEDGKMYWSNWSGVLDVANAVQIQRGLGSSKLAISSVGGTVNIVTKSTDRKEGGFVKGMIGNDAYYKGTVAYSTGKNVDSPFGVTALFTHWQGDGYNDGTRGQGQNYFFSVGYQLNEKNNFNFLITGAPQWHDQNFSKSISTYLQRGRKFNSNWGTLNGDYLTERRNYYHKPVANLNWDLDINEKMSLSTVLYGSWGRGGGTGGYTRQDRDDREVSTIKYNSEGQIDFDAIANLNSNNGPILSSPGYSIRASVNNHQWYGVVSNFNLEINDNWSWNIGADGRYYNGEHFRQFTNFLGFEGVNRRSPYLGDYTVTKTFEANPWSALFSPNGDRNQRYNWDYEEKIQYIGGFTQFEYKSDNLSGYVQGALSSQGHQRWDYYNYENEADVESEKVTNTGFNLKGGMNFKFDEQNNVFLNMGHYSRQPFHDNIYLNFRNDVDPEIKNEKISSVEAGYGYRGEKFAANVNLYYTVWANRTFRETTFIGGGPVSFLFKNITQVHKGLEIDFTYRPIQDLEFTGYTSLGNWNYSGRGSITVYDEDLNIINSTLGTPESIDLSGVKVGDAAQTTAGLGANYKFLDGFRVDANWNYFSKLYSAYTPDSKSNNGPIELPSYDLFDLGVSYKWNMNDTSSLNFRANVNNLFDEVYISESDSSDQADTNPNNNWNGINKSNRVYFGFGRTWNFSVQFNF